jgi:hypothetical protein
MKTSLKGKRFQDVEGMKGNVTAELKAVFHWRPLLTVFRNFFLTIQVDGDYFEQK